MAKVTAPVLEPTKDKLHITMHGKVIISIGKEFMDLKNMEKRAIINAVQMFINEERLVMHREENPNSELNQSVEQSMRKKTTEDLQ